MLAELSPPTSDEIDLLGLIRAVDGGLTLATSRERDLARRLQQRGMVTLIVPESEIGDHARLTSKGAAFLMQREKGTAL